MDTVAIVPPVTPSVRPAQDVWLPSAYRLIIPRGAASRIGEYASGVRAAVNACPAGPIRSQVVLDGIQTSGLRSAAAVIHGSSATTSTGLQAPFGGPIVC